MLNQNSLTVGDTWSAFYDAGNITWADPGLVGAGEIAALAAGPVVQAILRMAGASPPEGTVALEAGCGLGLHALALATLGYRVEAFDLSQKAVDLAVQIGQRAGQPQVTFRKGDLLDIGWPEASFDMVFNQAVMEYFVADDALERAIAEMMRVLKPGGSLVLVVQNTAHALWPFKRLLGWRGYGNQPDVRRASASDFARRFRKAGLAGVRVDGIEPWKGLFWGVPFFSKGARGHQASYLAHRALSRFVPLPASVRSRLAVQFVVAGRKP